MLSKLKEILTSISFDKEFVLPLVFEYTSIENGETNKRTLVHPVTITQELDTLVINTEPIPLEQDKIHLRMQSNSSDTIMINDTVYTYTDTGEKLIIDEEFRMEDGIAKLHFTDEFYTLVTKIVNNPLNS